MLLVLLYHGINRTRYSNNLNLFQTHLEYLSQNFPIILPGEKMQSSLSICLSFDDSCFDIYHLVFPLLKKYKLKALLSIPAGLIPSKVLASSKERLLAVDSFHQKKESSTSPFCTWEEILEMSKEGIQIASHGFHHVDLTKTKNLEEETIGSKLLIEEKLKLKINSFVYPFGAWNHSIHHLLKDHYRFIFRIGSSCNFSWDPSNKLLYRIPMDGLLDAQERLHFSHLLKYFFFYLKNRLLGR